MFVKLFVLSCLSFLVYTDIVRAQQPLLLLNGTWVSDIVPDPFIHRYPTIEYLPAGTIVFETDKAPLNGYFAALTHNGFWVQIATPAKGGPKTLPLSSLSVSVPSDALFVHRSIFCLSDTNRIVVPGTECESGAIREPVGEGWLFRFSDSEKPSWVVLQATLDNRTRHELEERGWDSRETEFEIKKDDLKKLETKGYLTLLNREYPVKIYGNRDFSPVILECGARNVTQKELSAAISTNAEVSSEASFLGWISAKLGISAEAEASASKKYTVEIDTTKKSYMYYAISVKDFTYNENYVLNIEKVFECLSGFKSGFGEKLLSVNVQIERAGSPDPIIYNFDLPEDYAPMPAQIYDFSSRPLFISLNSPQAFSKAVDAIMQKWGIEDRIDAEFLVSLLNYSCPGAQRKKCDEISSD